MESLTVHWAGASHVFDGGAAVLLGRDPEAGCVIDNPHVSRRHVELRPRATGWVAVDLGSTQGTFIDGERITERALGSETVLVLGRPGDGAEVRVEIAEDDTERSQMGTLLGASLEPAEPVPVEAEVETPVDASPEPADVETAVPAPPVPDPPVVEPAAATNRPGGGLREEQLVGATEITDAALNVECAGRSYQLRPDRRYVIGRDTECDIVSVNPTVSREHAALEHEAGGWVLRDLGSSSGTFVEGRRVTEFALQGANAVFLGDPTSGERVVLKASGVRPQSVGQKLERAGRRGTVLVAVGAFAVVGVMLGGVALLRRDGGSDPQELSKAAVNLDAGRFGGSGSVVDAEQGLILTNAHVVAPSSPGQALELTSDESSLPADPEEIVISVSSGLDKAAEPRFIGEVVAADGYLDLAVVRIVKTASGNLIEPGDLDGLVELPLGDSDDVRTGDDIRVIGYPGISESAAPTLTEGIVSGTVQDDRVGSNRAYINVDADINPGNSGGTAVDDSGRLIGVPTLLNLDEETLSKSNRLRPINLAKPLIDAARSDTDYESDFVTPLAAEALSNFRLVVPPDYEGFTVGCTAAGTAAEVGRRTLGIAFDYSGFPSDAHQDLRIDVVDPRGDVVGRAETADEYPLEFDGSGCATLGLELIDPLEQGAYLLAVYLGPNYRNTPEEDVALTVG